MTGAVRSLFSPKKPLSVTNFWRKLQSTKGVLQIINSDFFKQDFILPLFFTASDFWLSPHLHHPNGMQIENGSMLVQAPKNPLEKF